MRKFLLILFISFPVIALVEKSKTEVPTPEIKVESTKEKSKLKPLETGVEVILHHREPMLYPDGRVIEVHYFSHKRPLPDERRRASVGLKIWDEKGSEMVILTQDLDRDNKETLSTGETEGYSIKLVKMVYDDQITVIVSPK